MRTIPEHHIGPVSLLAPFRFAGDPLRFLKEGFDACGDTYRLRLFREFVITRDPAFFRHILQQNHRNYKKGSSSKMLRPVLGNGLVTSDGDFWLRQRRLVQPAFHRERLQDLFVMMGEIADRFLDEMEQHRGGPAIDMDARMMAVTSDIALKTLFGNMTTEDKAQIYRQVTRTQKYLVTRVRRPYRIPLMAVNGEDRHFKADVAYFNTLVFNFIQQRRVSGEQPNDLLQLLLDSRDEDTGEQMDDQQIRDEAITMFAAGHETSATGLSWLLYELAAQPDIVAEIRREAALFDRVPGFTQLMQMPYTRQVVEEGLRLYPPAWTMTRESIGSDEIGGFAIAPGTSVFMSIFELHRNPGLWKDPTRFDPANFEPEAVKGRSKYQYLPFGLGPRICIGQQFAMMEMQLLLAALVKRFDFVRETGKPAGMHPQIVLKSSHGIKLYIK
ncbi:cytochrome P450 [Dyadobacter sandarakinus]|uniref:Cytochrome P450 n=1 Tax=Dyadobacter sandarakinus TaxID=2747268 RepID=A0ABX7I3W4_9BACT|nr:cytochrome P450 [Dyadobacter sandarakinus]QRR00490.1 cytochrome P450 [Dyadobacter sandarakinus]